MSATTHEQNEFSIAPPFTTEQDAVLAVLAAALERGELDELAHRQASRILTHHYLNYTASSHQPTD